MLDPTRDDLLFETDQTSSLETQTNVHAEWLEIELSPKCAAFRASLTWYDNGVCSSRAMYPIWTFQTKQLLGAMATSRDMYPILTFETSQLMGVMATSRTIRPVWAWCSLWHTKSRSMKPVLLAGGPPTSESATSTFMIWDSLAVCCHLENNRKLIATYI